MTNTNLTADTITDDQILALRDEATDAHDSEMVTACEFALSAAHPTFGFPPTRQRNRQRCADAINAARAQDDSHSALVLVRSDRGDGGWSLHAPGSTDEEIADGTASALASGPAEKIDGEWSRPNASDYARAEHRAK